MKKINPNKNAQKGFQNELLKASHIAPSKPSKEPFNWGKNVSGGETKPNAMNTPRRLSSYTSVAKGKVKFSEQTNTRKNKLKTNY